MAKKPKPLYREFTDEEFTNYLDYFQENYTNFRPNSFPVDFGMALVNKFLEARANDSTD